MVSFRIGHYRGKKPSKRHTRKAPTQKSIQSLRNRLFERTLKFTETIVVWVTILYIANWVVSVGLILTAIIMTQNFSYLDTLITETSETFRQVVIAGVIKFGVENIFKFNDFVPKKNPDEPQEESIDDGDLEFIDLEEGGTEG